MVVTTVKIAKKYQARLWRNTGRFQDVRAKILTTLINWLRANPRYSTATPMVIHLSGSLFLKNPTRAKVAKAANSKSSRDCALMSSIHVAAASSSSAKFHPSSCAKEPVARRRDSNRAYAIRITWLLQAASAKLSQRVWHCFEWRATNL